MSEPIDERDQVLDLYHRTTREAAESILREGTFRTRENTEEAFVSNRPQGYADEYGDVVVHVRIPESLASLEDEFQDGEEHYRIPLDQAEVVEAFTIDEDGQRTAVGVVTDDQVIIDVAVSGTVMVGEGDGDAAIVEVVDADGVTVELGEVSPEELQAAFETDDPAAALAAAAVENSAEAAAISDVEVEPYSPGQRIGDAVALGAAGVIAAGAASDLNAAVDAVEQRLDWVASAETPQVQAATADELVDSGVIDRVEGLRESMGVSRSQMTPVEVELADTRAEISAVERAESLRREIIDNPAVGAAYEEPRSVRDDRLLPSPTPTLQPERLPTTN